MHLAFGLDPRTAGETAATVLSNGQAVSCNRVSLDKLQVYAASGAAFEYEGMPFEESADGVYLYPFAEYNDSYDTVVADALAAGPPESFFDYIEGQSREAQDRMDEVDEQFKRALG